MASQSLRENQRESERIYPETGGPVYCITGNGIPKDMAGEMTFGLTNALRRGNVNTNLIALPEGQLDRLGDEIAGGIKRRMADNFAIVTLGVSDEGLRKLAETLHGIGSDSKIIAVGDSTPEAGQVPLMKRYTAEGFRKAITGTGSIDQTLLQSEIRILLAPKPTAVDSADSVEKFLRRVGQYPDFQPVAGWINRAEPEDRRVSELLSRFALPFPVFTAGDEHFTAELIKQLRFRQNPVRLVCADGMVVETVAMLRGCGMADEEIKNALFVLASDTMEMVMEDPAVTDPTHFIAEFNDQGGKDALTKLGEALVKE